jgi:hypothetical protein
MDLLVEDVEAGLLVPAVGHNSPVGEQIAWLLLPVHVIRYNPKNNDESVNERLESD